MDILFSLSELINVSLNNSWLNISQDLLEETIKMKRNVTGRYVGDAFVKLVILESIIVYDINNKCIKVTM